MKDKKIGNRSFHWWTQSAVSYMNLILVKREFLTKGTTGRGTRRSRVLVAEGRSMFERTWLNLFFLKWKGENRDDALNVPSVHPFPSRNGVQVRKFHFLLCVIQRVHDFCFQHAYTLLNGPERIFRCKCIRWPSNNPKDLFFCTLYVFRIDP